MESALAPVTEKVRRPERSSRISTLKTVAGRELGVDRELFVDQVLGVVAALCRSDFHDHDDAPEQNGPPVGSPDGGVEWPGLS